MKKAIAVERKAHYADFQGKKSTFSSFMRKTSSDLCRAYPNQSIWITIRSLFRAYPNMDVGSRISIIKRVEELLIAHNDRPVGSDNRRSRNEIVGASGRDKVRPYNQPAGPKEQAEPSEIVGVDRIDPSRPTHQNKARTATGAQNTGSENTGSSLRSSPLQSERSGVGSNGQSTPIQSTAPKGVVGADLSRPLVRGTDDDKSRSFQGTDIAEIDVQFVKGVGPRYKTMLANIGIESVENLLRHYPRRHIDFTDKVKISSLSPGQEVTIIGVIKSVNAFQSPKSKVSILTIVITDGTGNITITRFIGGKSNKFLLDRYKNQYPKGCQVMASGIVERDRQYRHFTLKNCELEILGYLSEEDETVEPDENLRTLNTGRLVPVYPLTEGLSLRHLRLIIHHALGKYQDCIPEILPAAVRQKYNLLEQKNALNKIHFPETLDEFSEARQRLVFDELFALQLTLAKRRHRFEQEEKALMLETTNNVLVEKLRSALPFTLTAAQERVFKEIAKDLASSKPMHRLVQGDVGSGKTIVALLSALIAIDNGYQVAMMAPTEILAEQHYNQCQKFISPLGLKCALVLGKHGTRERKETRAAIASAEINLIVGTHAILEDDVEFKNLGLIIIDEQHRFGVKQRARLKAKSQAPELLTMTATPIPRTLALTIHGDLDLSEIDELPPGRKPILTKLLGPGEKKPLNEFIKQQVELGRQIYIVFPLIEESETLSARAATIEYEKLKEKTFPDLRIGLMHGKLKPQEKEEVMDEFRAGNYDILVSTTVIEVGVDVPNATVMIIENADRFGLAQLHQLRGRVGRGSDQSYCFLVSDSRAQSTRDRLFVLTQTNDGFVVAEKDLAIRGPGEFLGFRQSGLPDLILTDLIQDTKILSDAREAAITIIKEDPQLKKYPALQKLLEKHNNEIKTEILQSG